MVVKKGSIQACMKCGCVYSEDSLENVMRCPVCKSMMGEDIEGLCDRRDNNNCANVFSHLMPCFSGSALI